MLLGEGGCSMYYMLPFLFTRGRVHTRTHIGSFWKAQEKLSFSRKQD